MLQKRGVPCVLVATEEFESLASSLADFYGYPDLPMVVVPHPFNTLQAEDVIRIAREKADEILSWIVRARGSTATGDGRP